MINLIPPDARSKVMMEYWIRVVTVWAFLVGIACLLVVFFLVPSYVLVHSQIGTYAADFQKANNDTQSYATLSQEVLQANTVATAISDVDTNASFSHYIDLTNQLAGPGITIGSIKLTRPTSTINTIVLTGQADTREHLALFRDTLSSNPAFSDAVLPISNLAKDKNVPFNIVISVNNHRP